MTQVIIHQDADTYQEFYGVKEVHIYETYIEIFYTDGSYTYLGLSVEEDVYQIYADKEVKVEWRFV